MDSVAAFLDAVNVGMNYLVAIAFLLALGVLVVVYTVRSMRKYAKKGESAGKGVFLGILALVEAAVFAYLIVQFPNIMAKATGGRIAASVFRWVLLYLILPAFVYLTTRKYSGRRGLYAVLVILTIGLLGWWFEHWIGILLISVPLYLTLLLFTYRLAQVVLPASAPENRKEQWPKFKAFLFYMLGTQYPFWAVKDRAGREMEMRIPGDYFNGLFAPGTVWTQPHQVVGISAGIEFNQADGPGILFTRTYDRPVAVVDLRTQIRTAEVDAVTKDGMPIRAIVFAAFGVDRDDWPKSSWDPEELKRVDEDCLANPLLKEGFRLDRRLSSYPYSTARVKSVLSTVGVRTNPAQGEAGLPVHWDEWALNQVENAARQVLSQRSLDQLWRPIDNGPGKSALDEIAVEVRKIADRELRRAGISLFASRVVNYALPKDHPVRKQQIDTWKNVWAQRITGIRADAEAINKEEIEKAHAYAKSEILDAIADSIQKAREVDKDLPRHVIAMYFIHAIEEYIQKQPVPGSAETKERLDMVKQFMLDNQ
jgi:hypothetical protein